ncbi:hypothetical protein PUNSTDRAFT_120727 [Punctularia strigosozonata HHB-11173 SS5]|uniref:uncharacterized protein n=1 Tax=Punctularia strigosozonata (strain HHB-11173) TaxID=741275 RepID=UPI0004416FBB|nr:uncharacterized protein PUNSTDRAFT_120727 [Punctularia strigosozonata HHB-11173 SS5]EIN08329.1 hypothetical protein PUNSTDRAFT_120727 [Punctularia strigosozonata HHB-11173 SS5]
MASPRSSARRKKQPQAEITDVAAEALVQIEQLKAQIELLTKAKDIAEKSTEEAQAAQQDAVRTARAAQAPGAEDEIIYRPEGTCSGGTTRKSFSLQAAMRLDNDRALYLSIQRTVHDAVIEAKLDLTKTSKAQSPEKVVKMCRVAANRQPYLRRFDRHWPTLKLFKQYLKNRGKYLRRSARETAAQVSEKEHMSDIRDLPSDDDRSDGGEGV